MKDVAKKAGVSVPTVSLVLNDAPGIAQATRELVRQVISELNYTPNDQARRLFSGRTGTVALVMPPWRAAFNDPYFVELMRGTLEAVRDRGYELLLEISDQRFRDGLLWKKLYDSKRVDGLLIATPYLDQDYLPQVAAHGVPAILINGDRPDLPDFHFVGFDDLKCGAEATRHLLSLGHRRIAHIAGPANQASSLQRLEGYQLALTEAGIEPRNEDVEGGDYMPLEARAALDRILERSGADRPTAFFCANDTMAVSVINHLRELGWRVPEDFSVIGVDDTGPAADAQPPLSTFRQDVFGLAKEAAELFLTHLEAKEPTGPLRRRIPMTFVPRQSCGPRR